ncbi:MAG: hypothetical protein QW814_01765, partial [Methanothrix sp.]
MKSHTVLVSLIIFFGIALLPAYSFSSSNSTLSANVVVGCPFILNMGLANHTAIPESGNYFMNYSLRPVVNCTVPEMKGEF